MEKFDKNVKSTTGDLADLGYVWSCALNMHWGNYALASVNFILLA